MDSPKWLAPTSDRCNAEASRETRSRSTARQRRPRSGGDDGRKCRRSEGCMHPPKRDWTGRAMQIHVDTRHCSAEAAEILHKGAPHDLPMRAQ